MFDILQKAKVEVLMNLQIVYLNPKISEFIWKPEVSCLVLELKSVVTSWEPENLLDVIVNN